MEPSERQPAPQSAPTQRRWARMRRNWRLWWRLWAGLLPSVFYLAGMIFHVRLNRTTGNLLDLAVYVYFGILLAPTAWALLRANPGVWRMRAVRRALRRVLVGGIVSIVGILGLAIAFVISGQTIGTAQIILLVITFGGMAFVLVAPFIFLLDESKDVIDRYRAEHSALPPLP